MKLNDEQLEEFRQQEAPTMPFEAYKTLCQDQTVQLGEILDNFFTNKNEFD